MFKTREYIYVKGEQWMECEIEEGVYRLVSTPFGSMYKHIDLLSDEEYFYDSMVRPEVTMDWMLFEERYLTAPSDFETSKLQGKHHQKKRFKNRDRMKNKRMKPPRRLKIRKGKSIHTRNILHQLKNFQS